MFHVRANRGEWGGRVWFISISIVPPFPNLFRVKSQTPKSPFLNPLPLSVPICNPLFFLPISTPHPPPIFLKYVSFLSIILAVSIFRKLLKLWEFHVIARQAKQGTFFQEQDNKSTAGVSILQRGNSCCFGLPDCILPECGVNHEVSGIAEFVIGDLLITQSLQFIFISSCGLNTLIKFQLVVSFHFSETCFVFFNHFLFLL